MSWVWLPSASYTFSDLVENQHQLYRIVTSNHLDVVEGLDWVDLGDAPFLLIRVLSLVPFPPSQNPLPFFPTRME